MNIDWKDFEKIEMRIGTILTAENFEEVRNPAYKMTIDFGEFGIRKTSAQITKLYQPEELIGKQIIAVMNFPPKQIANIMSECLVLGGVEGEGKVVLIEPERGVENGTKIN
ncbi:tRNA-binding protein [Brumimicrobium glaciale]|uniref:tRNA-binding protein n=1 Tax=Brumimicrobium glaciale TaxID=200475 RepID=A0A4Q4KMY0_9FLAO|nr:tRNA-binding protein [Brumimicrobium glaciale]RYM34783.1 tRNA-binding protein [Brumimicrobium glaciale]